MVEELIFNWRYMEHCCGQMTRYIADVRIPVKYSPICREYELPLFDSDNVVQGIFYCPWCGKKLPQDLRDEWFDILRNEYNIEPEYDVLKDKNIPEEFKSDAWWKKRGL